MAKKVKKTSYFFPPEWYKQSAIQLTWPHFGTDWNYMLEEIVSCYVKIARTILKYQKLIIVCRDASAVKFQLEPDKAALKNLKLVELPSNDTWARDHAGISVFNGKQKLLLDFTFNGWGLKFASNFDNQINRGLFAKEVFAKSVKYVNRKDIVLEGGALESDGQGTLLTTSECLLSPNRNSSYTQKEIEQYLIETFGLKRVLWLDHGYLSGDDTDSHIDTLARFCDEHTIAYVKCDDQEDEHYEALSKMEEQLRSFKDFEGNPYNLIELPMAARVMVDGERLPATYANFLIMNELVIVPFYNTPKDQVAAEQLQKAFPTREVIGIDCSAIIKQHGSLHCITMQYPEGYL